MSEMLSKQYLPWLNRGCMNIETLERGVFLERLVRTAEETESSNA